MVTGKLSASRPTLKGVQTQQIRGLFDSAALIITKEDIQQQARAVLPNGHVQRPARSEDVDSANPYCDCAMITIESSTNSCEQFGT